MDVYALCETLSSSSQLRVGKNTDLKLRGNVPQDVVWVIVHELVGRIRADILQQNFPAAWMIVQPVCHIVHTALNHDPSRVGYHES